MCLVDRTLTSFSGKVLWALLQKYSSSYTIWYMNPGSRVFYCEEHTFWSGCVQHLYAPDFIPNVTPRFFWIAPDRTPLTRLIYPQYITFRVVSGILLGTQSMCNIGAYLQTLYKTLYAVCLFTTILVWFLFAIKYNVTLLERWCRTENIPRTTCLLLVNKSLPEPL